MKNSLLEELAGTWEVQAEMDATAKPGRRETLRACADTLRMLMASTEAADEAPSAREIAMEELLRSAHAIAQRHGAGTAWDRFAASVSSLGIGAITARTYRVLPSD